jgi:type II secretory pathway component PulF
MNETTVAKMVAPKAAEKPVMVKEPTVDIVPKETNIVSQEKQEVPQMNELGEEQDSSTQLASVEIANFVQNHWLAILLVGGVFVVGLFFFMRRKREEDNQQPI